MAIFAVAFQGPVMRWNGIFGLGLGGIERMAVYPLIVWEIAFAATLMGVAGSAFETQYRTPH